MYLSANQKSHTQTFGASYVALQSFFFKVVLTVVLPQIWAKYTIYETK